MGGQYVVNNLLSLSPPHFLPFSLSPSPLFSPSFLFLPLSFSHLSLPLLFLPPAPLSPMYMYITTRSFPHLPHNDCVRTRVPIVSFPFQVTWV